MFVGAGGGVAGVLGGGGGGGGGGASWACAAPTAKVAPIRTVSRRLGDFMVTPSGAKGTVSEDTAQIQRRVAHALIRWIEAWPDRDAIQNAR